MLSTIKTLVHWPQQPELKALKSSLLSLKSSAIQNKVNGLAHPSMTAVVTHLKTALMSVSLTEPLLEHAVMTVKQEYNAHVKTFEYQHIEFGDLAGAEEIRSVLRLHHALAQEKNPCLKRIQQSLLELPTLVQAGTTPKVHALNKDLEQALSEVPHDNPTLQKIGNQLTTWLTNNRNAVGSGDFVLITQPGLESAMNKLETLVSKTKLDAQPLALDSHSL